MSNQPELTVIVVSWNVRQQLERCLESIAKSRQINVKAVVIDNASSDGSADSVRQKFPEVELIANSNNRGFAAAVNQGIERSRGDVILINPDLVLEPNTLSVLEQALESHPKAGIAGPRIVYPDGRLQPSVRRFPTTRDLLLTLSKLPNFFPGLTATYTGLNVDYHQAQIVDQVMGSCFLIRREALETIGKFDEGFYLWFEEVDFCRRAANLDWKSIYVPSALVKHTKGASFSQQSALWKHRVLVASMKHYASKHLGAVSALMVTIAGKIAYISVALQQLLNLKKPSAARNL